MYMVKQLPWIDSGSTDLYSFRRKIIDLCAFFFFQIHYQLENISAISR